MSRAYWMLLALLAGVTDAALAQNRLSLAASHDNTLYQSPADTESQLFELSNGAGNFLFVGRTGQDAGFRLRRALIRFDLASVLPADAQIVGASLTLHQTRAAPGSPPASMGLHRVLQAWGEGVSKGIGPEGQGNFATATDATWHHRLWPDAAWDTEGGSFTATPSAALTVGQALQSYTWLCSQAMLDDLNFWLANPLQNFGWAVVGGEQAGFSAHRFASRDNGDAELQPALVLYYIAADSIANNGFEDLAGCP